MPGFGKKIGTDTNKMAKSGDWRCATCKFTNTADKDDACGMCREPKKVLKEQPVFGGNST